MKISELTKQLMQIQLGHGDLVVEVHDGLDPSDPGPIVRVSIESRNEIEGVPSPKVKFIRLES